MYTNINYYVIDLIYTFFDEAKLLITSLKYKVSKISASPNNKVRPLNLWLTMYYRGHPKVNVFFFIV
jgi:hypothetical protein